MMKQDENVYKRKFGPNYEKPCNDPCVTLCTLSECQIANECKLNPSVGIKENEK